jgi:hypothetical protein
MPDYPYATQQLDQLRTHTDPDAEAVVDQLFQHYSLEQTHVLFRHIVEYQQQTTVPEFLRSFLEEPGELPAWVNPKRVKAGQKLFKKHGRDILLALLCRSLPMCYICANGAEVLHTTARLLDQPKNPDYIRRLLETTQFLIKVCDDDILQTGGDSIITIRKVRLIHATIRRYIDENQNWDPELGQPINQEDQLITLSAFSLEVLKGLELMGNRISDQEREDWCHLWATTGVLLGIQETYIPQTYAGFEAMSQNILASQAQTSEVVQQLCASCVNFMNRLWPLGFLRPLSYSFVKHFNDPTYRSLMGFNKKQALWDRLMPWIMKNTLGLDNRIERASITLRLLIRLMNRWLISTLSKTLLKGKEYFYLPQSLKD